jgi:hypothetical protein
MSLEKLHTVAQDITAKIPRLTLKERLAGAEALNEDLSDRLARLRRYVHENVANEGTRRELKHLLNGYDEYGNSVKDVDAYGRPKKPKNRHKD